MLAPGKSDDAAVSSKIPSLCYGPASQGTRVISNMTRLQGPLQVLHGDDTYTAERSIIIHKSAQP
jgi:hypothetical protein